MPIDQLTRRHVTALVGGAAAAWPFTTRAQQASKLHRIGLLRVGSPPPSFIEPFRQGLSALGYVEGRSIVLEYGIARSIEQLPDMAAELVSHNVDVLVASGTPAVIPARNATRTIPVVFVAGIDPVAIGLVTSLARPGGNVTGLTALNADLTGKRFEILKEIFPTLSRVAFLSRWDNPGHDQYVREAELAARTLGVELQVLPVHGPDEFDDAFLRARGANAIIQIDDALFTARRLKLIELAMRHRLPSVYGTTEFVQEGGFMALGPSYSDLYRRAASYVDKILKGTKPADLPVEQPVKFELVINLKTAKALGFDVPPMLLARADEVIE
jgi:putative ABC transport system substrate-binding protein